MRPTIVLHQFVLALGVAGFLSIVGCGKWSDNVTPTATPTTVPTQPQISPNTSLEKFAYVTASGLLDENYAPANVTDGILGTNTQAGFIWRPANGTLKSSWLKLEWNSQVNVTGIRLYDNPAKDHQILAGFAKFENSVDPTRTFEQVSFQNLPDTGATYQSIAAPSSPITAVIVQITDAKGTEAGLAEVVVAGTRVDEAIPEGNVARHGRISRYTSILSPLYAGYDTGKFRTAHIKDGNTETSWQTDANGNNAQIEMEFDRAYAISSIDLWDPVQRVNCKIFNEPDNWLNIAPRFKKAKVTFLDLSNQSLTLEKSASTASTSASVVAGTKSKKIRLEVLDFEKGPPCSGIPGQSENTGFGEVKITGSYAP